MYDGLFSKDLFVKLYDEAVGETKIYNATREERLREALETFREKLNEYYKSTFSA